MAASGHDGRAHGRAHEGSEGLVLRHLRSSGDRSGSGGGWQWWHLDRAHRDAAAWLAAHGVPGQAVEALLDTDVRPRLVRVAGMTGGNRGADGGEGDGGKSGEGGLALILRVDTGRPMLGSLRVWVDGRGIVSLSRERVPAIETCMDETGMDETGMEMSAYSPAALGTRLADLIEAVVDAITPRADALVAETEALEDLVLSAPVTGPLATASPDASAPERLAVLRRHLVQLGRKLDAQRDALAALVRLVEHGGLPGGLALDDGARLDLGESLEQCRHDASEVEGVRERALILRDELARAVDERNARHGFALSVAAAVFLPATFVTGLLGINVGGVPGAEAAHAFWWVAALCVGVAGVSAAFVLWRRWL